MKEKEPSYSHITEEMFAKKLEEICTVQELLSIGDIYTIAAEHFNNDVLDALGADGE